MYLFSTSACCCFCKPGKIVYTGKAWMTLVGLSPNNFLNLNLELLPELMSRAKHHLDTTTPKWIKTQDSNKWELSSLSKVVGAS